MKYFGTTTMFFGTLCKHRNYLLAIYPNPLPPTNRVFIEWRMTWSRSQYRSLSLQRSGVQISPSYFLSRQIFQIKKERERGESYKSLKERERKWIRSNVNWNMDIWCHQTILSYFNIKNITPCFDSLAIRHSS